MPEPTPEQAGLLERLSENESLTDNLTDPEAKALLGWAQAKILAETDGAVVMAAVSAANSSGAQGVQALLEHADRTLAANLAGQVGPAPSPSEAAPPETALVPLSKPPPEPTPTKRETVDRENAPDSSSHGAPPKKQKAPKRRRKRK